jgi:hypothetical protein
MTLLDATFLYGSMPGPAQLKALNDIRDVYGIWHLSLDIEIRQIRVEYDASRFTDKDVASLLRNAGFNLCGRVCDIA